MTPAVSGPTEREQRTLAILDKYDVTRTNAVWRDILCDLVAEADRESATLRARVAVLEQQIAAIEALCDEADQEYSKYNHLLTTDEIRAVLAAGVDPKGSMVVDNLTESGS